MFKRIIIFILLVNSSISQFPKTADIVEYVNEKFSNGFHFRVVTSKGQVVDETGIIDNGIGNGFLKIFGYMTYTDRSGKPYKLSYQNDENGFRSHSKQESLQFPPSESGPCFGSGCTSQVGVGGHGIGAVGVPVATPVEHGFRSSVKQESPLGALVQSSPIPSEYGTCCGSKCGSQAGIGTGGQTTSAPSGFPGTTGAEAPAIGGGAIATLAGGGLG